MKIDFATALLCTLGWILHWLGSWGEAWKKERKGLIDFIDDNPPAFWFSLIATVAVYLLGPTTIVAVLSTFGVTLPPAFDNQVVKLLFAFVAGYMADSIVYKISNLAQGGGK